MVLDYKVNKTQENIEWDPWQNKYVDILALFLEQYPAEHSNDFPHQKKELMRAIPTKMKAIRGKYRQALDSVYRSGHGTVVLLFFELCKLICGGLRATTAISSSIETNDLDDTFTSSHLPRLPHPPWK